MKKLMMLLVATMVLAGCNTMNGVGKDMEKAGEAVQKKASE
ncbi:entericidin A/B family lipoprotein [Methylophilus flavus]|jgi:entericidin B|uniref:Entericidin A/B family lipoprotein n=1 Tax=Methylophilus flavus TaxID=640084 RepID=A0ABW3P577_9PROT|nr:entericidin A/B family lipoprotein [Methylophilus sp.]